MSDWSSDVCSSDLGLRAQPIAKLRDNLQQLVALAKKAGAQAAVFEMLLPPNYGPEYVSQFTESFHLIAKHNEIPLVPFLLSPIAAARDAFPAAGIHPIAESAPTLLDTRPERRRGGNDG